MIFFNENLHYLYLVDKFGVVTIVPPESEIELPNYFIKYDHLFQRYESSLIPVYTPFPIGSEVIVYSISEIDEKAGTIVDKDEISYAIEFGTFGTINFPYSSVALFNPVADPVFPPDGSIIFFI